MINIPFSRIFPPGKKPSTKAARKPKARYPNKNKLASTRITHRNGVGFVLMLPAGWYKEGKTETESEYAVMVFARFTGFLPFPGYIFINEHHVHANMIGQE